MRRVDISGERYGKLVVRGYSHSARKRAFWACECDCGNTVTVEGPNLKRGVTKSCGCLRTENIPSLSERLWAGVGKRYPGECWEWQKATQRGYGCIGFNGSIYRAHRVSYELENGPIPNGLWVLHRCDNRLCVNPAHLFLGTAKDNAKDREEKSRGNQAKGEKAGKAKLRPSDVTKIRALAKSGHASSHLADQYGISRRHVNSIISGESWKHLA